MMSDYAADMVEYQVAPPLEEYRQRWQLFTRVDARRLRTPTEYLVDKFLEVSSLNIVYGAPAAMKSMLMADLCAHVALGTRWLPGAGDDGRGFAVTRAPVLWVDFDNGAKRSHQRFDAIMTAHNAPDDAPFYYATMPTPPLIAHDLDSMIELRDCIADTSARLVVIDNLGLITGDVEENSANMAQVMGNLRRISERTGAALVVIHHQRKGGAAGGRAGEALRGHSSIEASLDLALHVMREENSPKVFIRSTKTRGVDVPSCSAEFNYERATDERGMETNDLARAWFAGTANGPATDTIVKATIVDVIHEVGPLTKTLLAQKVKVEFPEGTAGTGIHTIRAIIDQMTADGDLRETVAKGNKKVIDVPF